MRFTKTINDAINLFPDIEGVIFDMDGLIFDTERTFMEQLAVVMWEQGYKLTRKQYCETLGMGGEMLKNIMLSFFGEDYPFEKISEETIKRVEMVTDSVGLFVKPEIVDVLYAVNGREIPCALASSSRTDVVRKNLETAQLLNCFSGIIGGDCVEKSKPSPEIFIKAAKSINIASEKCLVLEDSENGILAAKGAGCITVCVPDLKMPAEKIEQFIDVLVCR